MKARKEGESDASYIARLESANRQLRADNKALSKWQEKIDRAVTGLAVDASLALQAMAEKAGVRSHPSVVAAVHLLSEITYPCWNRSEEPLTSIEWPEDWNFEDDPDVWSGDAEMTLNAVIQDTIQTLDHMQFSATLKQEDAKQIVALMGRLDHALDHTIAQVKARHGFVPKTIAVPTEHFRDMDIDQLRETVSGMGWMALDLAQDMHFANFMLRNDLRAASYRRICSDLYRLSDFGHGGSPGKIDIKVLGGDIHAA